MSWAHTLWSYEGRLDRGTWWLCTLGLLAAYGLILFAAVSALPRHWPYVSTIAAMVLFRCHTALGVKRLHDQGRRTWPVYLLWFPLSLVMTRPDRLAAWGAGLAGECACGPVDFWSRWAMVLAFGALMIWMIWRLGFGPPGGSRFSVRRRLG